MRGGRMEDWVVEVGAGRGVRAGEHSAVSWTGERKGSGFEEAGGRRLEEG